MKRYWLLLYLASILEVGWVIGLAYAHDMVTWLVTFVLILVSNYIMVSVANVLPTGTVYAVFVGLGTVGTVLAGKLLFDEPLNWIKLLLIIFLLSSVLVLKLITAEDLTRDKTSAVYGGES